MPDILDSEKSKIRAIAANFAQNLWKTSFTDGLRAYMTGSDELYIHPARWKYCFKCGEINKKESMNKHECALEFKDFPILVQTSWYKLKQFFLTERYIQLMQDLGLADLPLPSPIVKPTMVNADSKRLEHVVEKEEA
ncbi:MAG: hypothetical protein GOP50_00815 [Candidatus Heimdallarchaeota archaeon]|nr:hypothetical protein [Candidatus Heimdallarchaeota archaeon]